MADNKLLSSKPVAPRFGSFESLTPGDIIQMLRRQAHWIVLTTLLVAGCTASVVWRLPDVYRAQTLIMVDPQKVPERYVAATVTADVGARLNAISQEVLSSTRLQRVIDTYGLYKNLQAHLTQEEIIEQMRKDTAVEVVRNFDAAARGLGAFRIIYRGRSPEAVAQVCNQLASMVIDQNLKVREQQAEGTSEFLDTQLGAAKQKLEEQEGKLRDFKLKHVGELPEHVNANVATLGRLQAGLQSETEALNRARQQEVYLQSLVASVSDQAPAASPGGEPAGAAGKGDEQARGSGAAPGPAGASSAPVSPELLRLRQERVAVSDRLQQMTARFRDAHPDVQRTRMELETLDKRIAAEEKSPSAQGGQTAGKRVLAGPVAAAAGRSPTATARAQLEVIENEIKSRQNTQQQLLGQIRVYQAKIDNTPIREQEIVNVVRDYEMSKTFYQSLLEKKMAADMAADLEKRQKSERFTVLDPARIPEKPFSPNRPALYLLGLFSALALGVGLALVLELRDDSVRKEGELSGWGMRVLARIPKIETAVELATHRRRAILRWSVGAVATLVVLVGFSFAAGFLVRTLGN